MALREIQEYIARDVNNIARVKDEEIQEYIARDVNNIARVKDEGNIVSI